MEGELAMWIPQVSQLRPWDDDIFSERDDRDFEATAQDGPETLTVVFSGGETVR